MRKIIIYLLLLFSTFVKAQSIIGGAGVCVVDSLPETAAPTTDFRYECNTLYDQQSKRWWYRKEYTGGKVWTPYNRAVVISQTSHGFAQLDPIYYNTTWQLATTADEDELHTLVVLQVIDANNFLAGIGETVYKKSHGKTIGEYYYLQDDGSCDVTADVDISDILYYVPDADNLVIIDNRPIISDTTDFSDNWGSQVAQTDATLQGDGTTVDPLKVDTTLIATKSYVDITSGGGADNWGTQVVEHNNTLSGNGTTGSPLASALFQKVNGRVFTLTSSDSLGVGTSPTTKFEVAGNAVFSTTGTRTLDLIRSGGAQTRMTASATAGFIGTFTNHDFGIQTNNTTRVTVASGGAVTLSNLAGSGDRLVYANSSGLLGALTMGSGFGISGSTFNFTEVDGNPSNELNTSLNLSGTTLQLTDAGGTLSRDLAGILPAQYWARSGNKLYPATIGDSLSIGASTPANVLSVHSGGATQGISIQRSGGFHQSDITNYYDSFTNKGLRIGGNASYGQTTMPSVVTINNYNQNSGGRVGIEADDPLARLHITVPYAASSADGIRLAHDATYYNLFQINNEGELVLRNTAGNVSIGPISSNIQTLNPSASLHLFAPIGTGETDLIALERSGGYRGTTFTQFYNTTSDAGLKIRRAVSNGGTTIMRINESNQRVAIGASDPSATLHVQGNMMLDTRTGTASTIGAYTSAGLFTELSTGTGIGISLGQLINTSPDQTVSLTGGGITSISGTYPNFTITSTEVDGSTTNEINVLGGTYNSTTNILQVTGTNGGGSVDFDLSELDDTFTETYLGTVTSVGLSLPSIFTVSGSPVTSSGTLTGTLASQSANLVFASPNGSAGAPSFRALASSDLPAIDHGALTGLGDDDHTQYHNDTRGDIRYYTKTLLNAGQLNNLYYTETEIDAALALKQNNITLTTTGTSGAATLIGSTLNIPNYSTGSSLWQNTTNNNQTNLITGTRRVSFSNGNGGSGGSSFQALLGYIGSDQTNGADYPQGIKTRHNSAGSANNGIEFWTWQSADGINGDPTKFGAIITDGKLGIGTQTPATALDVNGGATISGLAGSGTRMVTATSTGVLGAATIPTDTDTHLGTNNLTQTGTTRVYTIAASGSLNFSSSTGDAQIGIGNAGGEYITADVSSGAHYSTLEMRDNYGQFGFDGNNILYTDDNGVKIQINGSYGTSGNVLISGGAGSTMTWGKPAIQQVDNYSSSTTWNKPTGCKTVTVTVIGGGGGGGGGSYIDNSTHNSGSGGGGGGAGGRSQETFDCSSITSTVTITVGSGGSGGAAQSSLPANGNNGNSGNQSSFGSYLKANGGGGGQGGQLSATSNGGTAGLGSSCDGGQGGGSNNTASAGTTGEAARYASGGGNGGAGVTTSSGGSNSTSTPPALGTTGSVTLLGSGGTGGAAANSGGSGGSYGGGGGGGGAGRSATHIQGGAGGSGAGGYVQVITHF